MSGNECITVKKKKKKKTLKIHYRDSTLISFPSLSFETWFLKKKKHEDLQYIPLFWETGRIWKDEKLKQQSDITAWSAQKHHVHYTVCQFQS